MSTFINILTLSRIILGVVIFLLLMLPDWYLLALILFFFAGVTDYFDGYLARKYNAVSQLGEVLDPIADKILIVFVLFGFLGFYIFEFYFQDNNPNLHFWCVQTLNNFNLGPVKDLNLPIHCDEGPYRLASQSTNEFF